MNCSFTGHRKVEDSHYKYVLEKLASGIAYVYSEGCRSFLCGGAVGFDTLAAREVIRFRLSHPDVRLVMVLPCREQSERWSGRDKDAYEYVLSMADEIIYTSDSYHKDCMRVRNLYLASNADILISYVYNEKSGSGQTVRMAKKLSKRVYNICPSVVLEP